MTAISISQKLWDRIMFYVENCPKEISGLGTVKYSKKYDTYDVKSICLLDQEVGATHTDIDPESVNKAMFELKDAEGELAFWWHSHVDMATFWSGQDKTTIQDMGKNGLCIACVFNKKEEVRGAICFNSEDRPMIFLDDVTVEIEKDISSADQDAWLSEIKAKVREKTFYNTNTESFGRRLDWRDHNAQGSILNSITKPEEKSKFTMYTESWYKEQCPEWDKFSQTMKDMYGNVEEYFWSNEEAWAR